MSAADILRRADRVATSWWFGDLLLLGIGLIVVTIAVAMTPSEAAVSLFGHEMPVVCSWRRWTGMGCPGCGLTRSFAFMAEGAVVEAFRMNLLGPPLFALVASQVPYRIWRLVRGLQR